MKLIFVLIVLSVVSHRRVCSGHNVKNVLPFLVRIEAKGKISDCAGTVLSSRIVLTSAHCVDRALPSDVTVKHFGNTLNTYQTALIVIYPDYNATTLANDIALLHLHHPFKKPYVAVTLTSIVQPPKCTDFQIVGWSGPMDDSSSKDEVRSIGKPMTAPIKLMPNPECTTVINDLGGTFVGEEKLCGVTNDDGECFTGPGGPLLCVSPPWVPATEQNTDKTTRTNPAGTATGTSQKGATGALEGFESTESPTRNETLADPIDLLANLEKVQGVIVKRAAEETFPKDYSDYVLQIGVVSWGKSCSKVPSVYVRTDLYYSWIINHLKPYGTNMSLYPHFTFLTPLKGGASLALSSSLRMLLYGAAILLLRNRIFNFEG